MGFWSTSLYGNDLTLDVRDKLDDLLKSGVSPQDVYQEMLKCFEEVLSTDEESLFWFALADRMWDYGILTDEIKEIKECHSENLNEIKGTVSHRRCGTKNNHNNSHEYTTFFTAPVKFICKSRYTGFH